MTHYAKLDDFGGSAGGRHPKDRSLLMKQSVESVIRHTPFPAEFIVMDNGGDPDDTDWLLAKAREGAINTLVRYKENMHFAYAWNQGAKIANGTFLCFMCNDVEVSQGWLEACVKILEYYKDERIIATPFITYDKRRFTTIRDGCRWNPRSGSNCMVLTRQAFAEIGEFRHHRIAGTLWYNRLQSLNYQTVAPPEDLAVDLGWRSGVNFSIPITVKQTLLDGTVADYSDPSQ